MEIQELKPKNLKDIIHRSTKDFYYFIEKIFSISIKAVTGEDFVSGQYVKDTADFLQFNKKTFRIAAKDHFKSSSIYAHYMWELLKNMFQDREYQYFSYKDKMAAYHIKKIKNLISNNPFYVECRDLKPQAEAVCSYSWDGLHKTTLEPHGLLSFKRGIHAPGIYVDDPLQDPSTKLDPVVIKKIGSVWETQIIDMPTRGGFLHGVGTPQTQDDFFFNAEIMARFKVDVLPAIKSYKMKIVLWEEWMDFEELMKRKKERPNKFAQEYQCSPIWTEDSFIDAEKLDTVININLVDLPVDEPFDTMNDVIAGFDIGRKHHPSHLSVYEIKDNKLIQIHQKFMDRWKFANKTGEFDKKDPSQLEYLKLAITNLKIDRLFYDNTKGEFETFVDQGLLPPQMLGLHFSSKLKDTLSTRFAHVIENKIIELMDNKRQRNQMLIVDKNLKAIVTTEGHGDCFWSTCLALSGWFGEGVTAGKGDPGATLGEKSSLFDKEGGIPSKF